MKILTIIPVWKRPDILEICLDGLKHIPVEPLFIISHEDPYIKEIKNILKEYNTCTFPNFPVGRKLNAGINLALKEFKFDYLMNFGSDNIVSPELFAIYKPYFEKNKLFFGVNNLYIMNYIDKEIMFVEDYNIKKPIGAARMIHRSILNKMFNKKQNLYDNLNSNGMDTNSQQRIYKHTKIEPIIIDTVTQPFILDIKTATNINTFQLMIKRAEKVDNSKEIIEYFSNYSNKLCRKYRQTY